MAALGCGLLMIMTASVRAQEDDESRNIVRVILSDLDLTRTEDRARLDRRIRRAIDDVCGSPSTFDLAGQKDLSACRDQARAMAVAQQNILLRSAATAQHNPVEP